MTLWRKAGFLHPNQRDYISINFQHLEMVAFERNCKRNLNKLVDKRITSIANVDMSVILLPTCVNDIVEVVDNPVNKYENIINNI